MTSIKSLFDTRCSAPNSIVSLSKNFSQTNSILPSTQSQFQNVFHTQADIMTQEYLYNVGEQSIFPTTTDMSSILQQYTSSSLALPIQIANHVGIKQNNAKYLESWINEFSSNTSNSNSLNLLNNWIASYLPSSEDTKTSLMNEMWNEQNITRQAAFNPKIFAAEFLEQFDGSVNAEQPEKSENASKWVDEFTQHFDNSMSLDYKELHDDAYEIFSRYESEWRNAESILSVEKYSFNSENPFLNEAEPVNKAKEFFLEGNIVDAILCYESTLQKNPQDSESWCSLGLCHAENEQDVEAILAFKNALNLNPLSRRTLIASTVSLANEGYESIALGHLDQWISLFSNQHKSTLPSTAFAEDSFFINEKFVQDLENKFLSALNSINVNDTSLAVELQNALSIYYNITQNYEKAVDAIRTAISINSKDPVLWNRLGASLANNDRSAEAISAYRKALELFPAYVRGRYNLGISCMNLTAYKDAIGHFLSALRLQKSKQNSQIWSKIHSCVIRLPQFIDLSSQSNWTAEMLNAIDFQDIEELARLCDVF